jgi:hypothetical protein
MRVRQPKAYGCSLQASSTTFFTWSLVIAPKMHLIASSQCLSDSFLDTGSPSRSVTWNWQLGPGLGRRCAGINIV